MKVWLKIDFLGVGGWGFGRLASGYFYPAYLRPKPFSPPNHFFRTPFITSHQSLFSAPFSLFLVSGRQRAQRASPLVVHFGSGKIIGGEDVVLRGKVCTEQYPGPTAHTPQLPTPKKSIFNYTFTIITNPIMYWYFIVFSISQQLYFYFKLVMRLELLIR
jgi:hypothetical protein